MKEFGIGCIFFAVGVAILAGVFIGIIAVWQNFRVYFAEQTGRAEYARAEQNRKITVLEAQAANESATQNAEARVKIETANGEAELAKARGFAQAEIERARGVAEANAIIADGLKNNEEYLRYLWIDKISTANTFYIPTEANLPILEAGQR